MPRPRITLELLHRLKSPKGGYTREALAILEIPWPPKKGWRKKLMIEAKENFARDTFKLEEEKRTVPASNFMGTVAANVDNEQMSDTEFRQFVRNTLPIVQYDGAK